MFKFKIKIQNEHTLKLRENNEHKLKLRENNEHRFSIKAIMATIIIYVGGVIRYSSKTVINKAVILARAVSRTSYRGRTSIRDKVFARLRGVATLYRSSSRALEKFLVKVLPSSIQTSLETTLLGKVLVRFRTIEARYSINTLVSRAVILARALLTNSYRSTTSAIGKVFVRIRGGTRYNSSSRTSEKFLVKLSPLPLEGIPLREYSDTLLKNLHKHLKFLSYVTSDIYQSFCISFNEKVLIRLGFRENRYTSNSQVSSNVIQAKIRGAVNFSSNTLASLKAWVRGRGVLVFTSRLQASTKATIKAFSSLIYRANVLIRESIGVKERATNNSRFSTRMIKEGVGARAISQAVRYVYSTTARSVNKMLIRLRGQNNSFSSKTEADESKMFEYYTIKLSAYQDKKLNEVPNTLLRLCYVVDKNWISVAKIYKTWLGVKERASSWKDLK